MRHLLQLFDLTPDEVRTLLDHAARLKAARKQGLPSQSLAGKVVGLVFEKPSLRTRVSFEAGIAQLGGTSLFMPGGEVGLGWRETLADFARTMSRYVDAMVFRVFKQETVEGIASVSGVPVINALSDEEHPCQALADLLTIREKLGEIAGKTVAFVGDGNNVAKSLAVGCGKLGAKFVLGCPKGYGFDDAFLAKYRADVGGEVPEINDPAPIGDGGRRRLHGRVDEHGSGGREGKAERRFRPVPTQRETDEIGPGPRRRLALPPGSPRRGDHERGRGRPPVGRLRSGGKPVARPEGGVGVAGEVSHKIDRGGLPAASVPRSHQGPVHPSESLAALTVPPSEREKPKMFRLAAA